jgi:RNA polymerase sigma-70 factor (ECF subfamily)
MRQIALDEAAFEQAYAVHRPGMLAAARQVLRDPAAAEDVVQDIFLHLWRSPGAYDRSRGPLRGYLLMLARHRALDRWRSRSVGHNAVERLAAQAPTGSAAAPAPEDTVIQREVARAVREAVGSLPGPQRDALVLAYGGGLSVPEVATATGTPLGTAKSRVRLGLRAAGRELTAGGAY